MHLLVILVILLIIFGPGKLAELGKSLGEGIKNFKSSVKDEETPTSDTKSSAATPDDRK
ncbi:MAG: hypothetical protein NVS9B15_15070 [Acidobacteriaceae bacterium]